MAVTSEEIRVRASVNVAELERELAQSLQRTAKEIQDQLEAATAKSYQKRLGAEEELAKKRQKIGTALIDDERKRGLVKIQALFEEEKKRITELLQLRLKAGEITEQQFRQSLAEFDQLLEKARDAQIAKLDAPQSVLARFEKVGGVLGTALGFGLGTGIAKVMSTAVDALDDTIVAAVTFERQMLSVRRTTGLLGSDLKVLGEELLELSGRLGTPVAGLTEIAAIAGQLGIRGVRDISAFTEAVAKVAEVTDFDETSAANALARISNLFRLPIAEAERLASVLNALKDTTTATAPEIAEMILKIGTAGTDLGLSVDQVAALGVTLRDAGLDVGRSGTSIARILQLIRTEGEKLAPVLGITRKEFDSLVRAEPLEAVTRLLDGFRAMPAALRDIAIRDVFSGNADVIQILIHQTENLRTNLEEASAAIEDGTSINREFQSALEGTGRQWDILTSRIAAGAISIGQRALPFLSSLLKSVNDLGASAGDLAHSFSALTDEIKRTSEVDELITRYEDLARLGLQRSAEQTEELRQVSARLKALFPGYTSDIQDASGAFVIYTAAIRAATAEQRALASAQRETDLRRLVEQMEAAAEAADRLFDKQALLNAQLEEGSTVVGKRLSAFAQINAGIIAGASSQRALSDAVNEAGLAAARADAKYRIYLRTLGGLFELESDARKSELADHFMVQGLTAEAAKAKVEDLATAYRELASAQAEVDGTPVTLEFDFSTLSLDEVRRRIAEVKAELDGLSDEKAKNALQQELSALLARERLILEEIAEEVKKLQKEASKAAVELTQKERQLRIDAIEDEHKRSLAAIDLQFQKERESIEKLLRLRLQAGQLTRDEFEAQLAAFNTALGAAQERVVKDLNARREKAEEDLGKRREKAEAELQGRISGTRRAIALQELEARQRDEQQAFEESSRQELDALEARVKREEQLMAQSFDKRKAQADSVFEAERERIAREVEDRTEAELLLEKAALERVASVAEAEESRVEATRKLYEDLAKDLERKTEELARQIESQTTRILGVIRDALSETSRLTDTDIELTRFRFQQQEEALRESLREQRISQREYDLEVRKLVEDRAQFEEEVEEDRASTVSKIISGLTTLLIEEAIRLTVRLAAEAIARQIIAATSMAATVAKVKVAMLAIASSAGSAAAAVSIATFGAAAVAGTSAALAGIAAVKAATVAGAAFEAGGYTGVGGRKQVAGVVHKDEFVFTKPAVRGQPRPFYLLMEALEQRRISPEDLEDWLNEMGYSRQSLVMTVRGKFGRVRASELLAAAGMPGYATGGFVDSAALTPAPFRSPLEGIDLSELSNSGTIEAIRELGAQISDLQVQISVGRRVQSEIIKSGSDYLRQKTVANRFRK